MTDGQFRSLNDIITHICWGPFEAPQSKTMQGTKDCNIGNYLGPLDVDSNPLSPQPPGAVGAVIGPPGGRKGIPGSG